MRLFICSACRQVLFFENHRCANCGAEVAFLPDRLSLAVVNPKDDRHFGADLPGEVRSETATDYRHCRNRVDFGVCNWAMPAGDAHDYCLACRLNEIIPDLSVPKLANAWQRIERAKRRWLYTVLNLDLRVASRADDATGLVFAFLAEVPGGPRVFTGHDSGRITINVAEADDAERESMRVAMREGYRTLIGHFRHESGHYFWDRLVRDGGRLERFRALFGDERADYAEALARHHEAGPSIDWSHGFVSAYASAHPWEDWAETWAHYFHMVETLDTACAYGLSLRPPAGDESVRRFLDVQQIDLGSFDRMLECWIPLTIAFNSLNRGMGLPDFYPFLTTAQVGEKLRFVHDVIIESASSNGSMQTQTVVKPT